jgi:hypothetical protein
VGGDTSDVHPAGAVLDVHQDVQPGQPEGIDVQEVDGEDPDGLGIQELRPGRPVAAGRRFDARRAQDLVDGRWRDRNTEVGQLAVNAPAAQSGSRVPGGW